MFVPHVCHGLSFSSPTFVMASHFHPPRLSCPRHGYEDMLFVGYELKPHVYHGPSRTHGISMDQAWDGQRSPHATPASSQPPPSIFPNLLPASSQPLPSLRPALRQCSPSLLRFSFPHLSPKTACVALRFTILPFPHLSPKTTGALRSSSAVSQQLRYTFPFPHLYPNTADSFYHLGFPHLSPKTAALRSSSGAPQQLRFTICSFPYRRKQQIRFTIFSFQYLSPNTAALKSSSAAPQQLRFSILSFPHLSPKTAYSSFRYAPITRPTAPCPLAG